jgi:ribosome-binding ATPase YchF (GTP1/OBG family)
MGYGLVAVFLSIQRKEVKMKVGIFAIPELTPGKVNVKDSRLDAVDKLVKAKKRTYVQVDLIGEDKIVEADAILALSDAKSDLVLRDLEFVETRLGRAEQAEEKALLNKLKAILEKEEFIFSSGLSSEEKALMSAYGVLTMKPVILAAKADLEDTNALLARVLVEAGHISFFTAGEKETRAWLIKKGTTAWEASGSIHSDIQKGFIRAEIISLADYLAAGGETPAKQAGKQRVEMKDYVMQDADLTTIRCNK